MHNKLSPIRQSIVQEAESWVDTPYIHRQRCKGVGVDCVQFLIGVSENVGLLTTEVEIPYYSVQWHLHLKEELLLNTVIALGGKEKTFDELLPGDFILFKIGHVCSHTGIYLYDDKFIHALCPYPSKVIKRSFDGIWKRKLAKRFFAFPGVDD